MADKGTSVIAKKAASLGAGFLRAAYPTVGNLLLGSKESAADRTRSVVTQRQINVQLENSNRLLSQAIENIDKQNSIIKDIIAAVKNKSTNNGSFLSDILGGLGKAGLLYDLYRYVRGKFKKKVSGPKIAEETPSEETKINEESAEKPKVSRGTKVRLDGEEYEFQGKQWTDSKGRVVGKEKAARLEQEAISPQNKPVETKTPSAPEVEVPKGKVVTLNGTKYEYHGRMWTDQSGKFVNRQLSAQLNQVAREEISTAVKVVKTVTEGQIRSTARSVFRVTRQASKIFWKAVPIIGDIFFAIDIVHRALIGDWVGSGVDILALAVNPIPYVGTAATIGLVLANVIRDVYKEVYQTFPEEDPDFSQERLKNVAIICAQEVDNILNAQNSELKDEEKFIDEHWDEITKETGNTSDAVLATQSPTIAAIMAAPGPDADDLVHYMLRRERYELYKSQKIKKDSQIHLDKNASMYKQFQQMSLEQLRQIKNNPENGIDQTILNRAIEGKEPQTGFFGSLGSALRSTTNYLGLTNSAGTSGPSPTATKQELASAQQVIDMLKSMGYSETQAAGIAANIDAESSFDLNSDNGTHYGLAQWSFERQEKFRQRYGHAIRDPNIPTSQRLQEQLDFIDYEMKSDPRKYQEFLANKQISAEGAARFFDDVFEVSGGGSQEKRVGLANQYMEAAHTKGSVLNQQSTAASTAEEVSKSTGQRINVTIPATPPSQPAQKTSDADPYTRFKQAFPGAIGSVSMAA